MLCDYTGNEKGFRSMSSQAQSKALYFHPSRKIPHKIFNCLHVIDEETESGNGWVTFPAQSHSNGLLLWAEHPSGFNIPHRDSQWRSEAALEVIF